jgi:hypothetical protein
MIMMMEKLVKCSEKTGPNAALSPTNPTCCQDTNPGRRDGKPATNLLSYETANWRIILKLAEQASAFLEKT